MFEHFCHDWAYAEPNFFGELSKNCFPKIFTLFLLDGFLDGFSKFWLFIVKICILIRYFFVIFERACTCWAYLETILSHTEHTRKWFYRTLSMWGMNFCTSSASGKMCSFYMYNLYIHAEHTRNQFHHTLSIRGTNFIAHLAYAEWISSLAEHTRKCLKVKYLGRIKYDFQKSHVIGPWDHKVSVSAKKV